MQPLVQDPLVARAEAQWGLLRPADLAELGVGRGAVRHRVATGRLHVLHPGVVALGHRVLSRKAEFLAAVWWCGGDAALADVSACTFLGWVPEDRDHPPPVHVTTTELRRLLA